MSDKSIYQAMSSDTLALEQDKLLVYQCHKYSPYVNFDANTKYFELYSCLWLNEFIDSVSKNMNFQFPE